MPKRNILFQPKKKLNFVVIFSVGRLRGYTSPQIKVVYISM